MLNNYKVISFLLLALYLSSQQVLANLPFAVDGQQLPSLAPMLEKVNPAVVNIATSTRVESPYSRDPFFRFFFQQQPRQVQNSLGSGVIVDAKKGLILTNHHVIDGADEISVSLADGTQVVAKLIGSDASTDIAVIKIDHPNLTDVKMANSDKLRVGDFVVAIGNPFGLGQSVTSGIVSALGRSGLGIERYEDFIQTDAAINPGNSGGALVNLKGELIGINTAIVGPSGGNVGIGFAIPINLANRLMQQIVEHGEVRRGILEGVSGDDLTEKLARAFDVRAKSGVIVTHVEKDSPAAKAGLKRYDIITQVNGRAVKSMAELVNLLGIMAVDDAVDLTVLRGDKAWQLNVPLSRSIYSSFDGAEIHALLKDVRLKQVLNQYEQPESLLVKSLTKSSPAYAAGLRKGDIIFGINRYRVRDKDMAKEAADLSRRIMLLRVQRGYQQFTLKVVD